MKLFGWYRNTSLVVLNIGGFILGCIAGLILWEINRSCDSNAVNILINILTPFGNVLISMLKMIVIPIIFFSLVCGASSLPLKQFGKMGLLVALWYLATSLFAAVFGCTMARLFNPTLQNAENLATKLLKNANEMAGRASGDNSILLNIIYGLFENPFKALAEGKFLPVIVFAILFGLAARMVLDTQTDEKTLAKVNGMLDLFDAVQKAIFQIVNWVMRYFPIGVFALAATCFATYGINLLTSYFQVAACVIVGILGMIFICYPAMILLVCRENPYPVLWKLREPILTAFVTRSSAAALPVSLKNATNNLKVKPELAGFTLSLGATVNMDGVCIHLPVFAILAANLFNLGLGPGQLILLVITVVFASVGAGGVPGGSIFLLFMVLDCVHLTPEQTSLVVALALGINPLLDMFETACNVAGDNVGTYVVGKKLNLIDKQ